MNHGIPLFIFISLNSLFFASSSFAASFHLSEDCELLNLQSKESKKIPAGKSDLEIQTPSLLKAAGKVPVLLLPVGNNDDIKVDPPEAPEVAKEASKAKIDQMVSEIMLALFQVRTLVENRKTEQAWLKFGEIKTKYGDVPFLDFTYASLLLLKGETAEAIEKARSALKAHPDYEEGKAFVEKLEKGGS